jgi:6-phosphogluconolactonase
MCQYELWAGCYTGGRPGTGAWRLGFDGTALKVAERWQGLTDSSYLQPVGGRVFAVEELPDSAALVELLPGGRLDRRPLPGSGLCHVTAWGGRLYASGYSGGCLAGLDLDTGKPCCYLEHSGQGPNPARQDRAHIHSAQPSPDGSRLLVADLGLDRLFQYAAQPDGALTPFAPQPWVCTPPGEGPRHFAFHPSGQALYLAAELGLKLLVYRLQGDRLEFCQAHALGDPHSQPESLAADVQVSPDGRFVYASVRGADAILCFRAEDPASLRPAGSFPSGGRSPRSFSLSPDGLFLAAANQSGVLAVFPLDRETGALLPLCARVDLPEVCCVKFA